jgi:hypothetical protein
MRNIPDNITRDDMLKAIEDIDTGHHLVSGAHRSRLYCLEYNGKCYRHFPPKEVIRRANFLRNGKELEHFSAEKRKPIVSATLSSFRLLDMEVLRMTSWR